MHRTSALAYAVQTDAWAIRVEVGRSAVEVSAWTSGRRWRLDWLLLGQLRRPFGSDGQHGLLDVERAEHLLDDVVVHRATGADLQYLIPLDVDGLQPQPPILLSRSLVVARPAEFFPQRVRTGSNAVPEQLHRLGRVLRAENVVEMSECGVTGCRDHCRRLQRIRAGVWPPEPQGAYEERQGQAL